MTVEQLWVHGGTCILLCVCGGQGQMLFWCKHVPSVREV